MERNLNTETSLNPFNPDTIPPEFITAVGKDDVDVVNYINSLSIEGLSAKSLPGTLDKISVSMRSEGDSKRGSSEIFTVDPNIASDEERAKEIWRFLNTRYAGLNKTKKKFD